MIDFDREPDFISEEGVKWWLYHEATKYAIDKGLNNIRVWAVKQNDEQMTFVITIENGDSAEVVYETKGIVVFHNNTPWSGLFNYFILEALFYHIDILWLLNKKSK